MTNAKSESATKKTNNNSDRGNISTQKMLQNIGKNAHMAISSCEKVLSKVKNSELKKAIRQESTTYKQFLKDCGALATELQVDFSADAPVTDFFVSMNISIQLWTKSTLTKIAEMMLLGTTMGIVDLNRELNRSKNIDEKVISLATKLLEFEQSKFSSLQKYL